MPAGFEQPEPRSGLFGEFGHWLPAYGFIVPGLDDKEFRPVHGFGFMSRAVEFAALEFVPILLAEAIGRAKSLFDHPQFGVYLIDFGPVYYRAECYAFADARVAAS